MDWNCGKTDRLWSNNNSNEGSIISETSLEDWRKVWNELCSSTTISDEVGATRVAELITRLEDLTDEIVDIERSRGRRR